MMLPFLFPRLAPASPVYHTMTELRRATAHAIALRADIAQLYAEVERETTTLYFGQMSPASGPDRVQTSGGVAAIAVRLQSLEPAGVLTRGMHTTIQERIITKRTELDRLTARLRQVEQYIDICYRLMTPRTANRKRPRIDRQ